MESAAPISKCLEAAHSIQMFPDELLLQIFSYLPPKSLAFSTLACRRWSHLLADDPFWKSLFFREAQFEIAFTDEPDWKKCYLYFFAATRDQVIGRFIERPEYDHEHGFFSFPSDRRSSDFVDRKKRIEIAEKYPVPAASCEFSINSLAKSIILVQALLGRRLSLNKPFILKSQYEFVQEKKFIPFAALFGLPDGVTITRDHLGRHFIYIRLKETGSSIDKIMSLQQIEKEKGDWWLFCHGNIPIFQFKHPDSRCSACGAVIRNGKIVDLITFDKIRRIMDGEVLMGKSGKKEAAYYLAPGAK